MYSVRYILWIAAGLFLIVFEFFVPGAVVIFFGMGALVTGVVVWLDLIGNVYLEFLFWIAASMLLVLLLRQQIMRLFPAIEKNDYFDEADSLRGQVVEVLDAVASHHSDGRVRYQGTSYQARALGQSIDKGEQAELVMRENLLLIVKRPGEVVHSVRQSPANQQTGAP
ncbi:MAG: NfeD family protein [Leptospiraceae bacterium]|nr:NfeD family protein [Leptospiraceae bacterium]